MIDNPKLKEVKKDIWLEGKVDEIIFYDKGKKLVLSEIDSLDLNSNEIPKRVRINVKSKLNSIIIGDRVLVKASLMPIPDPAIPGGFDLKRHLYFKQIGAIGYAMNTPLVIEPSTNSVLRDVLNNLRQNIASRIEQNMQYPASAVAIAMLLGDTSRIKPDDFEAIRNSGIAHLVAISGMHIVTVVGLIFLVTKILLTRLTNLGHKIALKKVSAFAAIAGTSIYLLISGAPVSAQRAFIMSCIILVAVVFDRMGSPVRSIGIAAFMILLVTPEALLSPSLQMSFTACIALVSGFNLGRKFLINDNKLAAAKALEYMAGVTFATLVAGIATAPLIIYHFNQFSTYSLVTNLASVPIADFIVMPFGILMLILMPLSLDFLPAKIIEFGLDIILFLAKHIASWPNASFFVPSISNIGIAMITLGFLVLCFAVTRLRLIGIPMIVYGLITPIFFEMPQVLVSGEAGLFAIIDDEKTMYVSSKQKGRFQLRAWQGALGINQVKNIKKLPYCSNLRCTIKVRGHDIKDIINSKEDSTKIIWLDLNGDIRSKSVIDDISPRVWNR